MDSSGCPDPNLQNPKLILSQSVAPVDGTPFDLENGVKNPFPELAQQSWYIASLFSFPSTTTVGEWVIKLG